MGPSRASLLFPLGSPPGMKKAQEAHGAGGKPEEPIN